MSNAAIRVEGVSKKYCRTIKHTMLYGGIDLANSFFGLNQHNDRLRTGEFWAVDDVSFELKRGETMGIIGPNGSGKSTILKMLNGIFMPDKGRVDIKGRVGALIEVGAGFHPMLTGRENIYINGSILGMSKKEIDKKFDEIIDFADIGDFIDSPVKHYSSGMYVRLGFSIAIHAEPQILLIDEVLAVGDANFKRNCLQKINELKSKGVSIIFVSHDLQTVSGLSDSTIVIDKANIVFHGLPEDGTKKYIEVINAYKENHLKNVKQLAGDISGEVEICRVSFFNQKGELTTIFSPDDDMIIRFTYVCKKKILNPVFSFGIYRDDGIVCCRERTKFHNVKIDYINGKGDFEIKIKKLRLNSGAYKLGIVIFDNEIVLPYVHRLKDVFTVKSFMPPIYPDAVFHPDVEWKYLSGKL